MGKRDAAPKQRMGSFQGIAHITEQEQLGRWHAIWVRRNPALADVDLSIRKQLAQMIVGPAVA
jgi:hypothetical protein